MSAAASLLDTPLAQRIGHTLPGRLACHAALHPDAVALREKRFGLWRPVSWAQYWEAVQAVAAQFSAWGLGADDRVAILCGNRPEWLYADLAIQLLGGMSAGIYETNPPADVAYVVNHARARTIICEDQEQVDKVLACLDEMPQLEHIVVVDPRGTLNYGEFRLLHFSEMLAQGRERIAALDAQTRLEALPADAPAMIIYTSGTTGQPKGALLSSRSAMAMIPGVAGDLGFAPDDCVLSYLPLCHVAEKIYTIFTPLTLGGVVHFGESIDTVQADLAEVAPSVFLGVPRIWEKMHSAIAVRMENASPIKRGLYRWALARGQRLAPREQAGTASPADRLLRRLIDLLVFGALRERIGLNRCRVAFSGAAPVAPELLEWFAAIGLPILEGYGMTETSGITHYNRPGRIRLGSVGEPARGVECTLAEDGEIRVRGPNIFLGYLDNPEATAEAIDADGWLATGDVGQIDDAGCLTITGRKKEILITAGGKNLSPARIENALKTSPYIKEAVAIGDARKFVGALVQIDAEMVGHWATKQRIAFTSFGDLAGRDEVRTLVRGEIDRANAGLAQVEQVRGFALLSAELNQDLGELTATQKVRRKVVLERHADLVDSIYAGKKA